MKMKNNFTPVVWLGVIIGHWNEYNNKFIPFNNQIINKFISKYWNTYHSIPYKIQISKKKFAGVYHAYRTFGLKNERTIKNI